MRGLGQWQATQYQRLVIVAQKYGSHTFSVDQSVHAVLSFRFLKLTTTLHTVEAMDLLQVRFTIENEQIFNGDHAYIEAIGKPMSASDNVCAYEVNLGRPVKISRDYSITLSLFNAEASTTKDFVISMFGLAADEG